MNFTILAFVIGCILQFEAAFLLLPCFVGLIYREPSEAIIYLLTACICGVLGKLLTLMRRKKKLEQMTPREGFAAVTLSWVFLSLYGAIPFTLTGEIPGYIDALFEAVSGFTATGSSVVDNVEALSYASLFWRSFMHWIGGMGIFVFIMAILPMMSGGSNMNFMRAESNGPSVNRLAPRVRDTAKIMYGLYFGLTVIGILALKLAGMSVFDAICTSFSSVGTGGFGVRNDSLAGYSALVQIVVTVLMLLAGVNYTFYFCLLSRQWKQAFAIDEIRWYFLIYLLGALSITANIRPLYASFSESARHAFFQAGAILTTTGFTTADFDLWPQFSKSVLLFLMVVGACAGSTGGGFKVSRIVILIKAVRKELQTLIHPRLVKKIKMDGRNLPHETLRSTNVFLTAWFVLLIASFLLVSLDEFDSTTNFTAVLASLNNIGPGLSLVGPAHNYASFSILSKCVLIFDMLAGRLELFPFLVVLLPSCWKKY